MTVIGLCATCLSMRQIRTAKGSTFYLCNRSQTDKRFPKYPPLPVFACSGWQEKGTEKA